MENKPVVPPARKKKPAQRAFRGLAGSALSKVVKAKRRGRPRKWKCDADRKRYERAEKRQAEFAGHLPSDMPAITDGQYMKWATHGHGLLITGGYCPVKIAAVADAAYQAESGRTGRPKGSGATDGKAVGQDEAARGATAWNETDYTFANRHRFPAEYAAIPSKPRSVKKLYCPVHSGKPPYVDDGEKLPVAVVTVLPSRRQACGCMLWSFELACGCKAQRYVRTKGCTLSHWELTDAA